MTRAMNLWAGAAWVLASIGIAVLVSDAVHDLSQAQADTGGLGPPIAAWVGETAFLASALIATAIALALRRRRREAVGAKRARDLHSRERRFALMAVLCVVGAIVTAAID